MENTNHPISIANHNLNAWNVIHQIIDEGRRQDGAFYVCDINDIVEKLNKWRTAMPRVKPYYAVKCNDHPIVLKVLAALGLGFDCASKNEIQKVLKLQVEPSRIIYAHTTKPLSHIKQAVSAKIKLTTFDNEMELYKLKQYFSEVRAVIRIRYDAKAIVNFGLKFGCDAESEAPELLRKANELGVNVVGVSFHIGSGCEDTLAFYNAIAAARGVFDCAATFGLKFNLLDVGGGYPGLQNDDIFKFGAVINKALDEYFSDLEVDVIAEPGAYFVQSAFTLACNIHSSKKVCQNNITTNMYYIDDGVFGSFGDIIYYNLKLNPLLIRKNTTTSNNKYKSVVWGPTCESLDRILSDVLLPEMEIGDWFVFSDMGAYTLSLSSSFNGFDRPDVYGFINNENWLLLRNKAQFSDDDFCNKVGIPIENNKYLQCNNVNNENNKF